MRYADDVRVYVASERAGQRVMASIARYVERRLKLKVSRQKSAVELAKKRRLLGFRFFGRDRAVKVRIDPSVRKRAKDRLRQLTSRRWGVSMERRIDEINRYTVGWTNYYALADTPSVFEGLDEWLRRRLRQVRWKDLERRNPKNPVSVELSPAQMTVWSLVLPGHTHTRTGIPSLVTARPITTCGRSGRWSLECPSARNPGAPSGPVSGSSRSK